MKLPALLRRVDPIDALNAQVARADEDGRDALARIEALTVERNRLLLDGSDEDVARVEAEMDRAQRDLDRAKARRAEANRRLAAAQQRQRDERIDGIHREGEAALSAIGGLVDRYGELVPRMVEIAREIVRHEAVIDDVNRRLAVEADPRRIPDPDTVHRPQRGGGNPLAPVSIPGLLRLPHPLDGTRLSWPENLDVFGSAVPPQDREAT